MLESLKKFLKEIIKIENVNISAFNNFTLISVNNHSSKYYINEEKKEVKINLAKLNEKEQAILKQIVQNAEKGTTFAIEGTESIVEEAELVLQNPTNQELIDFFSDKIPQEDLEILKSALVIRDISRSNRQDKGRIIQKYKNQLSQRFGKKANTVCNLVTSGYFEEFLIPLYTERRRDPKYSNLDFQGDYLNLITDFPIAIFVHRQMSEEEIELKIREKIEINKIYGIEELNIHGIGYENIRIINRALSDLEEDIKITTREIRDKIIIVKIHIPH